MEKKSIFKNGRGKAATLTSKRPVSAVDKLSGILLEEPLRPEDLRLREILGVVMAGPNVHIHPGSLSDDHTRTNL